MLKPIDLLVGLKILTSPQGWTQMGVAAELHISSSQVNSAIKQLIHSKLFALREGKAYPIFAAIKEFILHGAPYAFAARPGELSIGIPTAYAAEPLSKDIVPGKDPIPIWPYAMGKSRGVALEPLHPNIPKALSAFPDPNLYEILVLFDAIRIGRAREKNLACDLISKKIESLAKQYDANNREKYHE